MLMFGEPLKRLCCVAGAGGKAKVDDFVEKVTLVRLFFLFLSGADFMTDLWALLELNSAHFYPGVYCIVASIAVNVLAMGFGFFRTAQREQLLDTTIVRAHLWEHTVITFLSTTNLDSMKLLAWKDGRFEGFPTAHLSWLTPVVILQRTFLD